MIYSFCCCCCLLASLGFGHLVSVLLPRKRFIIYTLNIEAFNTLIITIIFDMWRLRAITYYYRDVVVRLSKVIEMSKESDDAD